MPAAMQLSTAVVQDAAVFQAYVAKTAAIDPHFTSAVDVSRALTQSDTISPEQLLRGEIAYAAIAALQDPAYVASVRAFAADPTTRQAMVARILSYPGYVVAFQGSNTAAGLAMTALGPEARKLYDTGTAVKQAAYDVQRQDWSKQPVADRPARLASAKSAGLANAIASLDDVAKLHAQAMGEQPMPLVHADMAPPYPPVIVRGLALAALAALGEAGDNNLIDLAPLFSDAPTATCLHTARLNLYQCLAVSRPNYEDIFCLGQHVLSDNGQCVMIAAGLPVPADVVPPPPKVADATTKKAKPKRHHK